MDQRVSASEMERIANQIRQDVLKMGPRSGNAMHIGPSLSCADILTALYFGILNIRPEEPRWPERDRFILSKGHACPGLYATLARRGFFAREELWNAKNLGSMLQGHPDMRKTPGVDFTSGSLGNGLSIGLGMALGLKATGGKSRVFVLLGDGESQEGMVWEAAMAAPVKGADNLIAVLDSNHFQSAGAVDEIMPLGDAASRWRAFGWQVLECSGHDIRELHSRLEVAYHHAGRPTMLIAHTVKGKGVSFMEHNNYWHSRLIEERQMEDGLRELDLIAERIGGERNA